MTPSRSGARTRYADLTLLEHSGDVLDPETASRTTTWLLATLADTARFSERTQPTCALTSQLAETLAAVLADEAVTVGTKRQPLQLLAQMSHRLGHADRRRNGPRPRPSWSPARWSRSEESRAWPAPSFASTRWI